MLQSPRKFIYQKMQKGRLRILGTNKKKFKLIKGRIAMQACESTRITFKQIEAMRKVVRRIAGRKLKYYFKMFPQIPISQKPNEIRLGKGKGAVKYWVDRIYANKYIMEVYKVKKYNTWKIKYAFKKGFFKLPIKLRLYCENKNYNY